MIELIVKRLLKLLTRRGYLIEDQGQTYLEGEGEESALSNLQAAATSYRIGLGPRRGKKVFTLRTIEAEEGGFERCVQNNGFSLHADVNCEADECKKLEQLCQYVARPDIANERLKLTDCGQVVLTLHFMVALTAARIQLGHGMLSKLPRLPHGLRFKITPYFDEKSLKYGVIGIFHPHKPSWPP